MNGKTERVTLLGFGLGGHHEERTPLRRVAGCSSCLSGYASPETWTPDPKSDYTDALVIDKRPAINRSWSLAIQAPIYGRDLAPDAIERLDRDVMTGPVATAVAENSSVMTMAIAGQLKTPKGEPGPMDRVGRKVYSAWWRRHGARTGRIEGDRIIWDDGEVQLRRLTWQEMAAIAGIEVESRRLWYSADSQDHTLRRAGEVIEEIKGDWHCLVLRDALAANGAPTLG